MGFSGGGIPLCLLRTCNHWISKKYHPATAKLQEWRQPWLLFSTFLPDWRNVSLNFFWIHIKIPSGLEAERREHLGKPESDSFVNTERTSEIHDVSWVEFQILGFSMWIRKKKHKTTVKKKMSTPNSHNVCVMLASTLIPLETISSFPLCFFPCCSSFSLLTTIRFRLLLQTTVMLPPSGDFMNFPCSVSILYTAKITTWRWCHPAAHFCTLPICGSRDWTTSKPPPMGAAIAMQGVCVLCRGEEGGVKGRSQWVMVPTKGHSNDTVRITQVIVMHLHCRRFTTPP